ncbi:Uncharacterized protein dnm_010700 [Desulfonema magnum]|uniref:Uncharacterized protein n=1 Tax=Desulfonema magnum TaxID=45655 RepID=A0A975BGM7_9BACT|nr:Uncharacterized protein dnm_010700 [Desulfonema magnum]
MSGNWHPQMNDCYPVRGNLNRGQNSAYGLLWPVFYISQMDNLT